MAKRATAYLREEAGLLVADLVVAETIYVLESFYEADRSDIGTAVRSLLALDSVTMVEVAFLLRSLEADEHDHLDFAEAYVVACAETTRVRQIASFERRIDRVGSLERIEP